MAYEIVSGLCCTYLFTAGAYFTLIHPDNAYMMREHLFTRSEFIENHLLFPMLVYQTYNLFVCLYLAELRGWITVLHHMFTGCLAYLSLATPYVQHSAVFFFGIVELTSIPLTILDICKFFPEYKISFPTLYARSKSIFYGLFIITRMIIWNVISFDFWQRSLHLLHDDNAPPSHMIVVFFLGANVILTSMQMIWGIQIMGRILKHFVM
jgi:hypothetical protein